jgi:hypothetical protein
LAEAEHDWAPDEVRRAVDEGDSDLIELVDKLLHFPGADLAYVAEGPLEDMLAEHPDRYAETVAERCRRDPVWHQALQAVWLDESEQRPLGA